MSYLPETGFVRIWQILGDNKATPPIPAIIPVAYSTWWAGCKIGKYPKPIKLSAGVTVWRAEEIHKLIAEIVSGESLTAEQTKSGDQT
jgi:prophage regulatory protein